MKIKQENDYLYYIFGRKDTVRVCADTPNSDILHYLLCSVTNAFLDTLTQEEKAEMASGLIKERIYIATPKL